MNSGHIDIDRCALKFLVADSNLPQGENRHPAAVFRHPFMGYSPGALFMR
jgi:hypothetical protein